MTVTMETSDRRFRHHSVFDLVSLIAHDSDVKALDELICYRKIFLFEGHGYMLLPDYLAAMWRDRVEKVRRGSTLLWDRARDLTSDKFTALPGIGDEKISKQPPDTGTDSVSRVDCRNYYAAFLKYIAKSKEFRNASGALAQDRIVAMELQRFVSYHFHTSSYLEAWRQMNPFISRYNWVLDGRGTITVWMPKYLSGRKRRVWLETHVADAPDPTRPGERERIQRIINKELAIPNFVPIDQQRDIGYPSRFPAPDVQADRRMRPSFIRYLAREKALSADLQRPALRRLGPEKIERLVTVVVANLATRERTDAEIGREFGLSKTAHSHFCGSEWYKDKMTGQTVIPDLWLNVAELLSQVDAFRDIAAEAGVFKAVATIVNGNGPAKLRRTHNVQ